MDEKRKRHAHKKTGGNLPEGMLKEMPWLGFKLPDRDIRQNQPNPYVRFVMNQDWVTARMEASRVYPPEGTPSSFVLSLLHLREFLNLTVLEIADAQVFNYSGMPTFVHQQAEEILSHNNAGQEESYRLRHRIAFDKLSNFAYQSVVERFSGKALELVFMPEERKKLIQARRLLKLTKIASPNFQKIIELGEKGGFKEEKITAMLQAFLTIEEMGSTYLGLLTGEDDDGQYFFSKRPDVYVILMNYIAASITANETDECKRLSKDSANPLGRIIYSLENAETSIDGALIGVKKLNLHERVDYMSSYSRLLVILSDLYFLLKIGKLAREIDISAIPIMQPIMKMSMIEKYAFSIRDDNDNKRLIEIIRQSMPEAFTNKLEGLLAKGGAIAQKAPKSSLRSFLGNAQSENYEAQLEAEGISQNKGDFYRADVLNALVNARLAKRDEKLFRLSTYTDVIDFARTRVFIRDDEFNNIIALLSIDNPKINGLLLRYGVPLPRIYFYNSKTNQRITPEEMPTLITNPLETIKGLFDQGVFSTIFIRVPFSIAGYKESFNLEVELFPESVEKNVHLARNRYIKQRTFIDSP